MDANPKKLKYTSLKKHPEFRRVMSGEKMYTKHFTIFFVERASTKFEIKYNQNDIVFGIMTSKKLGNSPERNFIKRRYRSAFHEFPWNTKMFYVILPKTSSIECNFTEILDGMRFLHRKMNQSETKILPTYSKGDVI